MFFVEVNFIEFTTNLRKFKKQQNCRATFSTNIKKQNNSVIRYINLLPLKTIVQ